MESWKELPIVLVHDTTSWKDLPSVLATNILSRLPVKTLVKYTSVCKSWYDLIKNPRFISAHINRSISNANENDDHYLLIAPTSTSFAHTCSVICEKTYVEKAKLEIPFPTESHTIAIIGSCNGLICLTESSPIRFGRGLYLWNPSVKKHKHIDSSCFIADLRDWVKTYSVVGFGFREGDNDYRIVRIVYYADNEYKFLGRVAPKVEVYSLRRDSWRRIGATVPRLAAHDRCVFVNGRIYWLEAKEKMSYEWILSFDLNDEVFHEVKLPHNFRDGVGPNANATIMEFKGLISLCVFTPSSDYGCCERLCVWVMKENDRIVSWTKQFKVVLQEKIGWPLKFTKSGKLLLEALGRIQAEDIIPDLTELVCCDLEKLQFWDLGKDGPYTVDASFMESLVMFDGGNALLRHSK